MVARKSIPPTKAQKVGGGSIISPEKQSYMQKLSNAQAAGGSTDHLEPQISFKYFDASIQCISQWQPEETKGLFNSLRILCQSTWHEIKQTGGKGKNNAGLRYKPVENLPTRLSIPNYFSEDAQIVEMGSSQKNRFFGIREDATFYLLWLDRNHEVFKE